MKLTRRQLAVTAASASLAAVPGIASAAKTADGIKWDKEVDVLVLGGGLGGLVAAIKAKESGGGRVTLVEKGSYLGGHALLSGGGYVACGSKLQKDNGVDDSAQLCWDDAVNRGLKANKFLRTYADVSKAVIFKQTEGQQWLTDHGVVFEEKPGYAYGERNRLHFFKPRGAVGNGKAIESLTAAAQKAGVEVLLETKLTELIAAKDSLNSPVLGAVIQDAKGTKINVKATKGVILATGGFVSNPDLLKRYHPYLEGIETHSSPLATGDGFLAALDLGAAVVTTHLDMGGTYTSVYSKKPALRVNGFAASNVPLIVADAKGNRFVDESTGGRTIAATALANKVKPAYYIYDSQVEDLAKDWYKLAYDNNLVNKYDSIEALAKGEGIDGAQLAKTIAQYNKDVAAGKDSVLGRVKNLKTIEKAPFFALAGHTEILYQYTGLEVNTKAQVLTTAGKPIPNLYAVGDMAGRCDQITGLGQGGVGGLSVATSLGLIAAENVTAKK